MASRFRGYWHQFGRPTLQSVLLGLTLLAVLTFQLAPGGLDLEVGSVAPRTIKSPRKVTFVSRIITDAERERAAAGVADVLDFDPSIANVQRSRLQETLNRIDAIRKSPGSVEQRREALQKLPDIQLTPTAIDYLLEFDALSMQAASAEALRLLDETERQRLNASDVKVQRETLGAKVSDKLIPAEQMVAVELAGAYLRPNLAVNEAATNRLRREARDAVRPVEVTVEQGETILRDGEIVKATDLEKLGAVGLRSPTFDWLGFAGNLLLVGVLVAMIASAVRVLLPRVWAHPSQLALLYLLIALAAVAAKVMAPGRPFFVYALPVAAVPMLVATLIDLRAAFLSACLLAVIVALMGVNQLELATLTLVGGIVGVLGVRSTDRGHHFIRAGLLVGLASFAVVIAFRLLANETAPQDYILVGVTCLASGLVAGILTLGTVSVLGQMFGLTTTHGLLELAHPTQPLFQRLLQEAPGTYHHSMMIANLAERAAQAIGADALLCRVGAYYHDIGKIRRPYFYIENQLDVPNIHDRLDPATSARIIASHVTDGVELAREYKLPSRVIDLIPQHHGTRMIGPFYWQACRANPENPPPEADFRYPGPRPQTKEAGIMMLADGVEAAVRASKDHSPEKIEAIINKLIDERIREGELEECDLTLRDIALIKKAFLTVLQGLFHPRVEYPDSVQPANRESRAPAESPDVAAGMAQIAAVTGGPAGDGHTAETGVNGQGDEAGVNGQTSGLELPAHGGESGVNGQGGDGNRAPPARGTGLPTGEARA